MSPIYCKTSLKTYIQGLGFWLGELVLGSHTSRENVQGPNINFSCWHHLLGLNLARILHKVFLPPPCPFSLFLVFSFYQVNVVSLKINSSWHIYWPNLLSWTFVKHMQHLWRPYHSSTPLVCLVGPTPREKDPNTCPRKFEYCLKTVLVITTMFAISIVYEGLLHK